MTEEIKEILEYLKDDKKISFGSFGTEYKRVELNDVKLLLNYITNLQKENEKYKKIFEAKERFSKIMPDDTDFIILSKADYDRQQEDIELTAIKLKSRNEKAVELIRKALVESDITGNGTLDLSNLLNILQGGDDND